MHGYFHWSLLDNYEWLDGFEPKFGLYEVDRATTGAPPALVRGRVPRHRPRISFTLRSRVLYTLHKSSCTPPATLHMRKEELGMLGKASQRLVMSVTAQNFSDYREEIEREKKRALDQYGMIVIAGVELSQNCVRRNNSAHVLALDVDEFISADGTVEEMLERAQSLSRIVVACHPHEQSDWYSNTFYLWNRREDVARAKFPYIGNSDFHKPEHLDAWKTLVPSRKNEEAVFRALEQGTGLGITRLPALAMAG